MKKSINILIYVREYITHYSFYKMYYYFIATEYIDQEIFSLYCYENQGIF